MSAHQLYSTIYHNFPVAIMVGGFLTVAVGVMVTLYLKWKPRKL